jgi:hypothetical protein
MILPCSLVIYAVLSYTKSVEAFSSDDNPVILVMDLGPDISTLQRMDPFRVNWAYYSQLLKQSIPGNPTITSAEEIDTAVTVFTSTIKSEKMPQNYTVHTRLETRPFQISRNYREDDKQGKPCTHFCRAADHRQYNFLKTIYTAA